MITQRRKQYLHEIQIEDTEEDTEEVLYSDDEYDPIDDTNNSEYEEGSDTEGEPLMTEERRLKCPHCNSACRLKNGLDSHTQSKHLGEYKCFECRWSFKSEENQEHIAYIQSEYDKTTPESVDSESESEEIKNNSELQSLKIQHLKMKKLIVMLKLLNLRWTNMYQRVTLKVSCCLKKITLQDL